MSNKSEIDPLLVNLFEPKFRKSDQRRVDIIKSAIRCIAKDGIEETTFESIGKPLKIRRSHVAYHFKDKGDIIETAIKYVIARGQDMTITRIQEAQTTEEKIVAIVEAFFDWAAADPQAMAVYLLFFYYCSVDERYKKIHAEIRETGAKRIQAVLAKDAAISKKRTTVQLEDLSKNIQYIATGALVDHLTTSVLTAKSAETLKKRTVQGVLALLK